MCTAFYSSYFDRARHYVPHRRAPQGILSRMLLIIAIRSHRLLTVSGIFPPDKRMSQLLQGYLYRAPKLIPRYHRSIWATRCRPC